jgi:DinB superfamily
MTSQARKPLIDKIRRLPAQIEALVSGLSEPQLTTHFLAGEWTVAQNVHHLADSHMNSYIRCKLILTEENPPLKPYDQDAWANLPDAQSADLSTSLALLQQLHARWVTFWETLPDDAWPRIGFHPANGPMTLDDILRSYADHGEAHIDQITRTLAAG